MYRKAVLLAALAAEAVAFVPVSNFGGLRLRASAPSRSVVSVRRNAPVSAISRTVAQLGINDGSLATALSDFKDKDGKVFSRTFSRPFACPFLCIFHACLLTVNRTGDELAGEGAAVPRVLCCVEC